MHTARGPEADKARPPAAPYAATPARPEDAVGLAALARITFPLACPPSSRPEDIERFLADTLSDTAFGAWINDPAVSVLVVRAHADNSSASSSPILGYAVALAGTPADPDVAAVITERPVTELSKLYVHPAQHGGGVADALMASVVEGARQAGHAGIWLGVNQQNERARRFYRRQGFEVAGTKHFRVGAVIENDYTMYRPLEVSR